VYVELGGWHRARTVVIAVGSHRDGAGTRRRTGCATGDGRFAGRWHGSGAPGFEPLLRPGTGALRGRTHTWDGQIPGLWLNKFRLSLTGH